MASSIRISVPIVLLKSLLAGPQGAGAGRPFANHDEATSAAPASANRPDQPERSCAIKGIYRRQAAEQDPVVTLQFARLTVERCRLTQYPHETHAMRVTTNATKPSSSSIAQVLVKRAPHRGAVGR